MWQFLHMYCLALVLLSGCPVTHTRGEYFFLIKYICELLGNCISTMQACNNGLFETVLWHLLHVMLSLCDI